jgi:hypothetical protein
MLSSDAALDRVCLLVATWMQNRRLSASDTLGDIADVLESTGRTVEPQTLSARPVARAHLTLVSDKRIF